MESSVGYETLLCHTDDLQEAVKESVVSVGAKLLSKGLIKRDRYKDIRKLNTKNMCQAAAELIDALQDVVEEDSSKYHTLTNVLKEDPQLCGILPKLHMTFTVKSTGLANTSESTDTKGESYVIYANGTLDRLNYVEQWNRVYF